MIKQLLLQEDNTHIYLTCESFHVKVIFILYITMKEFYDVVIYIYLWSFYKWSHIFLQQ